MTRARNLSGLSTVTGQPTTTTPVNLGPLGVGTFARIYGTWEQDQINAVGVAATNLQVSGITTGLNVSGIITAQNGLNVNGNIVNGLNVSAGIATFAGAIDANSNVDIAGNLTVSGSLTYEDLTDIDSIGVGTFRKGIIVAGVGTFSSGVGIADSIFHTGDDNTAIRFPAADTFTVETAGSEALRVNSNGNLLIGTTTEGATNADELTIATAANTGITLRSGNTSKGNIYFSDATSGADEYDGWIQYDHNARALRLATATAEALRIDSAGDVGIGDDDPDTRLSVTAATGTDVVAKFTSTDANAWIQFRDNSTTDTGVMIGASSDDMMLRAGSNERLRITSAGQILNQGLTAASFSNDGDNTKIVEFTGDGTVGEYAVLNMSGNQNNTGSNIAQIKFINRENSNNSSGANAGSRQIAGIQVDTYTTDSNAGDDCGGSFSFVTKTEGGGNSVKLKITSTGRLEQTSNNEDIDMDSSGSGQLHLDGNGYSAGFALNATALNIYTNSSTRGIIFGINEAERVRIETNTLQFNSTAQQIHLATSDGSDNGYLNIGASGAANNQNRGAQAVFYGNEHSSYPGRLGLLAGNSGDAQGHIYFHTGGTESLRITSGGKVNIGGDYTQTTRQLGVVSSVEQVASFEYSGADADGSEVRLYHNSSSPADDDVLGFIQFTGKNDADEVTMYSGISAHSRDVTNASEDGSLSFWTRKGGIWYEQMQIREGGDIEMCTNTSRQIYGGFGAITTGGTTDWNDASNARAGNGHTLLLGTATNGPGGGTYYHVFCYEYNSNDSTGNMTQLGYPYNGSSIVMRTRYGGTWSSWVSVSLT